MSSYALDYLAYPGLDPSELGLYPNYGYGYVDGVRTHLINAGVAVRTKMTISSTSTSISVVSAARLPQVPFIAQMGRERIRVIAINGNMLTATRGYDNTAAEPHTWGEILYEVRSEYVYLVNDAPIMYVDALYIDGIKQYGGYTAYSGRSGDEHADYPGKAVVVFSVDARVESQRNVTERLVAVSARVALASHSDLMDENSATVTMNPASADRHWVVFEGVGTISTQHYQAGVHNTGSQDGLIRLVAKSVSTGALLASREVMVPAGETRMVELDEQGGEWDTMFEIICTGQGGGYDVAYMKKTVMMPAILGEEGGQTLSPIVLRNSEGGSAMIDTPTLSSSGRNHAITEYDSTEHGIIISTVHNVELKNTGAVAARVRLVASEDGSVLAMSERQLDASSTASLTLEHSSGGWGAVTRLTVLRGEVRVGGITKDVNYLPSDKHASSTTSVTSASANVVIGKAVSVDALWTVNEFGKIIERPNMVLEHCLTEHMGMLASDIDDASFDAAGAKYDSAVAGGYKLGFMLSAFDKPSDVLYALARECRSTIRYEGGLWKLDFLPTTPPPAIRTITSDELAGQSAMFKFASSGLSELANEITALYRKNYFSTPIGSEWLEYLTADDQISIAKFGVYERVMKFSFIRDTSMAEDVLAYMLGVMKQPGLTVEFDVFPDHFDLKVGDVVDIENDIYDGKNFRITETVRQSGLVMTVTGEMVE